MLKIHHAVQPELCAFDLVVFHQQPKFTLMIAESVIIKLKENFPANQPRCCIFKSGSVDWQNRHPRLSFNSVKEMHLQRGNDASSKMCCLSCLQAYSHSHNPYETDWESLSQHVCSFHIYMGEKDYLRTRRLLYDIECVGSVYYHEYDTIHMIFSIRSKHGWKWECS